MTKPTPRTDAAAKRAYMPRLGYGNAVADESRKLERENAELREALQKLTRVFSDLPASRNYGELVREARAALAKTEGK